MGTRVRVHNVRHKGRDLRVLRLDPVPARLALRDDDRWLSMYADREGSARLVDLWALAARSPRSLIHLPIRGNDVPPDVVTEGEPVALDLVLLHHSLQFPTGSWKEVRARLGAGNPQTVTASPDEFPETVDHDRRRHKTYRDRLGFDVAAHTFFIVGSPTAFREDGAAVRGLIDEAPGYLHKWPNAGHFCVELAHGQWDTPTRKHVPGDLHIQYCPDWLAAPAS